MQHVGSRVVNAAAGTCRRVGLPRLLARIAHAAQRGDPVLLLYGGRLFRRVTRPSTDCLAPHHDESQDARESRLFSNIFQHMFRSGMAIVRSFLMFKPHVPLGWLALLTGVAGMIPFVRFLFLPLWARARAASSRSLGRRCL